MSEHWNNFLYSNSILYLYMTFFEPDHRAVPYKLDGIGFVTLSIEGIFIFLFLVDLVLDFIHRWHKI
jgi:hypothetical protein